MGRLWRRLKDVVVNRILGVADTPHRIAWGVLLGSVIAWTPTIGLQIVLYVAIATALRANKISGIPILFISNPVSAVPLYWFCWWVGNLILHGGGEMDPAVERALERQLSGEAEIDMLSGEFWSEIGGALGALGVELWLGSFVLGFATGIPLYFLTLAGVKTYRRARGH